LPSTNGPPSSARSQAPAGAIEIGGGRTRVVRRPRRVWIVRVAEKTPPRVVGCREAARDVGDETHAVDATRDRATDATVGEHTALRIERNDRGTGIRDIRRAVSGQCGVVRAEADVAAEQRVEFARFELHERGRRIGEVGNEMNDAATIPRRHTVRPRTDRLGIEGHVVEFGFVCEQMLGQDRVVAIRCEEEVDDRGIAFAQSDDDGMRIRRRDVA